MNDSYRVQALEAAKRDALAEGDHDRADRLSETISELREEHQMAEFLRNSAPERRQAQPQLA